MFLELDGKGDRYAQLMRALKHSILLGRLPAGTQLPATRVLAADLGLSRNTVVTAYEMLCAEQLAVSKGGSGTFVAPGMNPPSAAPERIRLPPQTRYAARVRRMPQFALRRSERRLRFDFQYGEPLVNPTLVTAWSRALSRAARRGELRYPSSLGLRALRQCICENLARRRGVVCDADDVLIVSGAQQAFSLLARVAIEEGDAVAIEDPGYELASRALLAHGAELVPIGVDAEGMQVQALRRRDVRMILVTPSHQFPTGAVLSLDRRLALIKLAVDRQCWIIEDDYDGEFRYDSAAIPALRSLDVRGRVIYVGSFSKLMFPGLRLGYMVCPRALRDDLIAAKALDDVACGSVEQTALAELMRSGAFDRHVRRAGLELRRRRRALIEGLRSHGRGELLLIDSHAGMHLVGWLPAWSERQVQALVATARQRGLGLHPISPHYRRRPAPSGLLLGYAGLSVKQLRMATVLFGACLEEAQRTPVARATH